jgi:hypothetical protein
MQIDHGLGVSCSLLKNIPAVILHFHIVYLFSASALRINVETYSLFVRQDLDGLLPIDRYQLPYFTTQCQLQKLSAKIRVVFQDLAEHKIITERQLFILFAIHIPPFGCSAGAGIYGGMPPDFLLL